MIGLINLEVKCAGARSAGNPHAACDVEGVGNGTTDYPSRARRGKPRIQTRVVLMGYRASSRPYQVIFRTLMRAVICPKVASLFYGSEILNLLHHVANAYPINDITKTGAEFHDYKNYHSTYRVGIWRNHCLPDGLVIG